MRHVNWSEKKVLQDEKWSRIYETDDGTPIRVSKFLTDQIEVSETTFKKDWVSWSESERLAFVRAFGRKPSFSPEDERILDFLMEADSEQILESIAISVTRHSQRERVRDFLIERLQRGSGPKANYAHALGLLRDSQAITALKDLHDGLAENIKENRADQTAILDFVSCCSALKKLEGSVSYDDEIRTFLNHPSQAVQNFAKVFLEGGPPSS